LRSLAKIPHRLKGSGQSPHAERQVRIGVGVLALRNNQILLGRRSSGHDSGTWQPPGGHLEFGETIEECARRELMEETAVEIRKLRTGPYTNDLFSADERHYISLFVIADEVIGEPRIMEPEKATTWQWFEWDRLPEPLFLPLRNLKAGGYDPFAD
jgi:8-oxo-dGTP diphosphatase